MCVYFVDTIFDIVLPLGLISWMYLGYIYLEIIYENDRGIFVNEFLPKMTLTALTIETVTCSQFLTRHPLDYLVIFPLV